MPGGTLLAVVGRSGAGKSLLAAVAGRLRDPDDGEVLLDGVPLPELTPAALHAAVGYAFDRPVLVGETVGDATGSGSAADAGARRRPGPPPSHDFVDRLPDGLPHPAGRGAMSGGETQRLGLARALRAGRLLILDDATSSLDTATEYRSTRALAGRRGRRTRLVVTHRARTAAAPTWWRGSTAVGCGQSAPHRTALGRPGLPGGLPVDEHRRPA